MWPNSYDREGIRTDQGDGRTAARDVRCLRGVRDRRILSGGPRAAIEMINGLYPQSAPEILFVGNTFSSTYIAQVMDHIRDREVCVNVISKSGTTTETALAFRLLKAVHGGEIRR